MEKEDIQKLRDIPIPEILQTEIRGRSKNVICPFHGDTNASLCIYDDNSFYCFGCKAKGKGAIDFLMADGMTFQEAIEELKEFTS